MEIGIIGLGLIIGSFLNVLILRTGTAESLGGRSHCPKCHRTLRWYDLIPVASWFLLSGRCRDCKAPISVQYPFVEFLTALLFLALYETWLPLPALAIGFAIVSLYIAVAMFDLRHSLIPDEWSYALAVLAFCYGYLTYGSESIVILLSAGPFAALPLFFLWAYSRGSWMGFGDVKLALSFGWLLGPLYGFVAVMFAFVIGAVVSIGILLPLASLITFAQRRGLISLSHKGTRFTMHSEVPFGPFLIASIIILWLSLLYGIHIPLIP